jgi:uncharacterized protein involved in outer membrane biogenesis
VNSFLLTLTAVLILVLGVLFAAPLFIDWNDYRPVFEAQAAKLLGRAVKVGGEVHLVLLPAPELRFDDVKVAAKDGTFEQPLLEARSIEALLNIGALMSATIEARKLTIAGPVLRLELNADGTGNWADVGRAHEALPFVPGEVMLDSVSVTDGRIELGKQGAPMLALDDVAGEASAASLTGPYKVATTYSFAGRRQDLKFSTSAPDDGGRFHLKSALRDPDRGSVYLLDGEVAGLGQRPAYDGNFILRTSIASGQPPAAAPQPAPASTPSVPPEDVAASADAGSGFELKGELNATADRAELSAFELTLHAKGHPQLLKGKLALDFGEHPKTDAKLAARFLDVDAVLADAGHPDVSPPAMLNGLAEKVLAEAAAAREGSIAVTIEQMSIGGDLIGDLDLALSTDAGGVKIDRLNAKLPGENRIEASGVLTKTSKGPVFSGPIKLEGSKLRTLARWASGDRDMSGQTSVGAFTLTADATLGGGDLKLDNASGALSDTKFKGAFGYRGGDPRSIELSLDSDRLDLKAVVGEDVAWRSWLPAPAAGQPVPGASDSTPLAAFRDANVHVVLRVGELLLPSIPPGRLDANFRLARDKLDVTSLDFAAEGALKLNGKGHIDGLSASPSGEVNFALQAATPESMRVAGKLMGLDETLAKSLQLAAFAPLDLQIGLTVSGAGGATKGALHVKGKAGGADLSLAATASGDPARLAEAEIELDGAIASDRPQAVLGLLIPGLSPEQLASAGAEPGKLTVKAYGVPQTNVTGRVALVAVSTQASFDGNGSLKPEGLALNGQAAAKTGNAALALALLGLEPAPSATGVPLDLRAEIVKAPQSLDVKAISGEIAGQAVQGSGHFDLGGDKMRFSLNADADYVSLPALLGSLIAWRRTPSNDEVLGTIAQNASDLWPARGFALRALEGKAGDIAIKAKTLALGAPFQIDDAALTARIDQDGLSITDLDGALFGGSFAASGVLSPKGAGAELKAHAELASGKLDLLTQSLAGRALAKGPFTLSIDLSGEGLSPPGLVAGLSGGGTLFLDPGALQALSLDALKRVAIEANRKAKLDKDEIAAKLQTLQDSVTHGTTAYAETAFPFEIKNGTLKLDPATLSSKGGETAVNGYLELASLRLDSEWAIRLDGGRDADMPPVNLVLAGSLADAGAISPVIDTAPIETFLTVSRMQEDVQKLETLDVSGRGQPQAADAAPDTDADNGAQDVGEPAAPAVKDSLAAEKTAVQKRAADRAAARLAEAKRIADEKAAVEKRAAEKAAAEKAAADKLAAEKAAADKLAAQKVAAEKAAADKAAADKAAADKLAAQQAAAEKAAADKTAAEQKRAAEKAAAEQAAAEKRAAEKAAAEKVAADKAAAKKAAAEKAAAEKAAADKAAAEKAAAEEKRAAEKAAAAKAAEEKRLADKAAAKKAAADKAAAEKAAEEKRLADKAAAEKAAADKLAAEKATADKAAEEKRLADKAAAEKAAADKAAAVKAAEDKRIADKVAAETAAADKAAADKAAAEKAAADKVAAEKAAEEKRLADKAAAEKAAATVPPRAADLEANSGTQSTLPPPDQGPEQLPWQVPANPALAEPAPAASTPVEQAPDAAASQDATAPVEPKPVRRRPPPAARDDWKKGVSIFGGG